MRLDEGTRFINRQLCDPSAVYSGDTRDQIMRDFFFQGAAMVGKTPVGIKSYVQLREKGLGREETAVMRGNGRPATHRVFI